MKLEVGINSKLEIELGEEVYKSIVQDSNDKNLLISIPVIDIKYLMLNTGEEIKVIYYDKKANIFSFKCKIIKRVTEKNIPLYSTSLPYDIEKIQRRNFVRVETVQLIKYIKKYDYKLKNEVNYELSNATLLDLSGGGMKIEVQDKLKVNDVIFTSITSDEEVLDLEGKIVRRYKIDNNRYIYGVKFWELNSDIQEKIIRIVFKIMRKQREFR